MKKFLTIIFIFTAGCISCQQKIYADDSDILLKSDFKTAYQTFNNALKNEETAENYLNMCKVTYLLRDDNNAKLYCKSALNYIEKEKHPDLELKSDIFSMLGSLYSTVYHNNSITFEYLNQAKELKEANPNTDKYELAKVYRNLAYMYNYAGNTALSENYYKKALSIAESEKEAKYEVIIALIYNDLALIERRKQNYTLSNENLVLAEMALGRAGNYINYALSGAVYKNIARYYEYNKHSKKLAEEYYQKSIEAYSKFPDNEILSIPSFSSEYDIDELTQKYELYPYDVNNNLKIAAYYAMKDLDKAETYFQKAIEVNPQNAFVYTIIARVYSELYIKSNQIKDESSEKPEENIESFDESESQNFAASLLQKTGNELLPSSLFKKIYNPDNESVKYYRLAKQYAKRAEEKGKYHSAVYFCLWDIYIKINNTKEAERCVREYIKYSDNKEKAKEDIKRKCRNKKISLPKDIENDILNK